MRNLIVTIYKYKTSLTYLARDMEDMRKWLLEYLTEGHTNYFINCLRRQRENPDEFPNIVIFLNEAGWPISIDEFMIEK